MKLHPLSRWGQRAILAAIVFTGISLLAVSTNQGALNLRVSQPPGSGQAILTYDLVCSNAPSLIVSVQVSTNGGATYDVPASSFSGDIGQVNIGLNKTIIWNMAADWHGKSSTNVWFRLIAAVTPPPTNMAYIPAGSFTMGDSLDGDTNALPQHAVSVSGFYMDMYLVTKSQWDAVMTWALVNGYSFDNAGLGKAANHPVQTVSWYDCVKWCNARSQMAGLTPAYYTDAGLTNVYMTGQAAPYVNWGAGYRLPTEAEWEYAARGGLVGNRFPWGNTITETQANYKSSSAYTYDLGPTRGYNPTYNDGTTPYTSPVGAFAPNGYGLYDMAGNVWQWCWDWYGSYGSASQTNPTGPHQAPSTCFAAAAGTTKRTTAGRRTASTTPPRSAATTSGSGLSYPQVSNGAAERVALSRRGQVRDERSLTAWKRRAAKWCNTLNGAPNLFGLDQATTRTVPG